MSKLCCCAFFIRFVFALLSLFEKYDKWFWLFSAITKVDEGVFRSHCTHEIESKMAPTLFKGLLLALSGQSHALLDLCEIRP